MTTAKELRERAAGLLEAAEIVRKTQRHYKGIGGGDTGQLADAGRRIQEAADLALALADAYAPGRLVGSPRVSRMPGLTNPERAPFEITATPLMKRTKSG